MFFRRHMFQAESRSLTRATIARDDRPQASQGSFGDNLTKWLSEC
jgi:hypothetical protein